MMRFRLRAVPLATAMVCGLLAAQAGWSAPTCPVSYGTTDAAKSHKLFLYFPLANDFTFPNFGPSVSPAKPFNVTDLDPSIGTTAALRDRVYDVVADDYCEFNVQVLQTTTNPNLLSSPPPRRVTVAVGSDSSGGWGQAQSVDIGNSVVIDNARAWAGTYVTCEGGNGVGGCSTTGALTGANSTLDRWAQAIGGTAAHEAAHTYGLAHSVDNTPTACGGEPGLGPAAGEDNFKRHLMPSGCNLDGMDRANYRRHVSDRGFGLLATNVGLSIQTMHNWDLVNPNSASASSLRIDFLSTQSSVNMDWWYGGASSPWINPVVSGPFGTAVWQGTTYNKFRITWSVGNPSWPGTPGVLPGGSQFHIGATFTGVDFNQPDPIIIQNITLFDSGSNPLTLHPRLPMYDAGTIDGPGGNFVLQFFQPGGAALQLQNAVVFQLPRVASIESMIGDGEPLTFQRVPITPWASSRCEAGSEREPVRCVLGNLADPPHVEETHLIGEPGVYDCSHGIPVIAPDSPLTPDFEGPICAGTSRDPFPSTTVYVIATFVDPAAEHWDAKLKKMVIGPVASKVFYQFAGVRDIRKLGKPTSEQPGTK